MREVNELIARYWEQICGHRRYFHENPEPSHREQDTAAYIAAVLREMGIEPTEQVGGYGIVAHIHGSAPGRCVALRADFDALEVQERTGAPFASRRDGYMHACGHDMHAAMLLGAAAILQELRHTFAGTVKLIFQPAEEDAAASGARAMIGAGCLNDPPAEAIFAQHVWPSLPTGTIGVRNGSMMGASDRFFITVHGKGGHGGKPDEGVDAVVIAAHIITALQTVVSRNVSPMGNAVVSVGKIGGGTRYNVIADTVKMEGTCRSVDPGIRELLFLRISSIAQSTAAAFGGSCVVDFEPGFDVTANSGEMFELMKESVLAAVGEKGLVIPENGALTGEDFSYYGKKIPSGFAWLGCQNEEGTCGILHSDTFLPREEAMASGTAFLVASALNFLEKGNDHERDTEEAACMIG